MTNSPHTSEQFETRCAGYVLNALDDDERRAFEETMADPTADQQQLYRQLRATATNLAFSVDTTEAPADEVLNSILSEIGVSSSQTPLTPVAVDDAQDDAQPQQSDVESSKTGRYAFAMAASFALLLISLALVFYSFNLNSSISQKEELITQKDAVIKELRTKTAQQEELLAILEARTVDLVAMGGLEAQPDSYGKVIWDPEKKQALLQVANLPEISGDKEYQLWLFRDNKPVKTGLFSVNSREERFFKIEQMADADQSNTSAFAVSLEPKGGSPKAVPTGDIYLLGNTDAASN